MARSDTLDALSLGRTELSTTYLVFGLFLALFLYSLFSPASLRHIPTVGSSSLPLLSYKGAYDFLRDGRSLLQRGYNQYKGKVFKVAFTDRWLAVVTGRKLVEEVQRLSDDVISFPDASGEVTGFKYIFTKCALSRDPFHVNMIQRQLTKHMSVAFDDLHDEFETAFKELLPHNETVWVPVHAIEVARKVVARASNRIFVGLPVCRDKAFLDLMVNFTLDVARARDLLALFPPALKPFVAKLVVKLDSRIEEGMQVLRPIIQERMEIIEKFGKDSPEKPDDMLQWIIDALVERNEPMEQVVLITLFVNIAAINTSSNSFTHALYHLAARPEWIAPLREEAEAVIGDEGWTKNAMGRLVKIDSFMRESQRYNSIVPLTCMRKALQPFTLSDGTHIPRGTILVTPAIATHFDDEHYADAASFDPSRYVPVADAKQGGAPKQYVTTTAEYVPFGHGKYACPGRFFAGTELKAMMAYLVLNYDVKFAQEGVRPPNAATTLSTRPHQEARVLFRKRNSSVQ